MRRLIALATIVVSLFAGSAAVADAKLPIFGTSDACACGGTKVLIGESYLGNGWFACAYKKGTQYWVETIYGGCPG